MFGIQIVPIVDLNLVTEADEQVFPIVGYAVAAARKNMEIHTVYRRWNINGKISV